MATNPLDCRQPRLMGPKARCAIGHVASEPAQLPVRPVRHATFGTAIARSSVVRVHAERDIIMPAYEYQCDKCQTIFLTIETFAQHDQHTKVECPKCGSVKVHQLISMPHVQTAKKS